MTNLEGEGTGLAKQEEQSTGMMAPGDFGADVPAKYTTEDFEDIAAGDWLPRLQLATSQSEIVTSHGFPVNHFAVIRGTNGRDLGETVDILILAWRPKALELGDPTITVFDKSDPEFARIRKDMSRQDGIIRMAGPEFLVYVDGEFATLMCGSKSLIIEAPSVMAPFQKWKDGEIPQPSATLAKQQLENKKGNKWWALKAGPCSTPLPVPSAAKVAEMVEKFNNPETSGVEKDGVEITDGEERAR